MLHDTYRQLNIIVYIYNIILKEVCLKYAASSPPCGQQGSHEMLLICELYGLPPLHVHCGSIKHQKCEIQFYGYCCVLNCCTEMNDGKEGCVLLL